MNEHTIDAPPESSSTNGPDVSVANLGATGYIEASGRQSAGEDGLLIVLGRVFRKCETIGDSPDAVIDSCANATVNSLDNTYRFAANDGNRIPNAVLGPDNVLAIWAQFDGTDTTWSRKTRPFVGV